MEGAIATQSDAGKRPARRLAGILAHPSAPWIAGVVVLYLFIALLMLQMWRTFIPLFDLDIDTRNAWALIHHGVIPNHGSVASYIALNAPGVTYGLVPGVLLFPKEPAIAEHVDDLIFFALTVAGLFALVAKRFGNATAFYCCALYMLSSTGLYFADFMRPRAHPVFLIWMLFFLDKWIAEKSPRALSIAVFIYILGNFWLLEFLPAGIVFIFAWLIYRPKMPRWSLLIALAAGFLIWAPYLSLEWQRQFIDLRCLFARRLAVQDWDAVYREVMTNPNLLLVEGRRVHDIHGGPAASDSGPKMEPYAGGPLIPEYEWVVDPRVGWCFRAKQPTIFNNIKGRWLCPAQTTDWWYTSEDGAHWYQDSVGWTDHGPGLKNQRRGIYALIRDWKFKLSRPGPLLLAPFPDCAGVWGRHILSVIGICGAIWLPLSMVMPWRNVSSRIFSLAGLDEKARACLTLLFLAGVGGWLTLMPLVSAVDVEVARRFMWLWVALSAFTIIFLGQILRAFRPWLAHAMILVVIIMAACNISLRWKLQILAANHFHAAPINEFNEIIDRIAAEVKAEGKTSISLGYDTPFFKWFLYARHADGVSKLGGQWDLILRFRHGIRNTDHRCEGVSPDDDFRIVEKKSNEPARQLLFDLSSYPRMDVLFETPDFLILQKSQK